MIFGDPDVEFVFGEVGDVARERGGVVVHGLAHQNPAHVRPPFAVHRRMRIAFFVGMLVMDAVRGYPEDRAALERERGANGQKIFDPFRNFIAAMREQAVIAHADAEAAGNPPEKNGDEQRLPGKEKQRGDCSDVERPMKLAVTQLISLSVFDFFFKTSSDWVMGASDWFFVVIHNLLRVSREEASSFVILL